MARAWGSGRLRPLVSASLRLVVFCACAIAIGGCVQLVAFDTAIIGQPDYVDSASDSPLLCDDEVDVGGTALCNETCTIDVLTGDSTCGERVRLDGHTARLDVAGLREVELTATVCGARGRAFAVEADNGASAFIEDRALEVRPANNHTRYRDEVFLPEDGCDERTLILQSGRLAMLESGRRVCSDDLLPFDRAWTMTLGRHEDGHGLQSLELCLRTRPPAARPPAAHPASAEPASPASTPESDSPSPVSPSPTPEAAP